MNDVRTSLRALVIYAVCVPLALILGYLLANPLDYQAVALYGILGLVMVAPLLLRFHYPFMLLGWNMGAVMFFLPGRMDLWFLAICLSYGISFTHRIVDKKVHFISVPEITRPLICLAVVVLATMQLRGGIALKSMGGDAVGGRYYFFVLVSILGYFALAAYRIPRARVVLFVGLFLLGSLASMVGDFYGRLPSAFNFIFWFIPPSLASTASFSGGLLRLGNVAAAAGAVCAFMLAKYGVRTILSRGRGHLLFIFAGCFCLILVGGFRSMLIALALTFIIQFWLEGMFRTKWVMVFGLGLILAATVAAPFVTKLPLSLQRTLAFLPIKVDPQAKLDANVSSEWRLQMWRVAVPMIPDYLLLGKGYGVSKEDFVMANTEAFAEVNPEDRGAFLAGDYHNGPLSVIIPFGLWGSLAFLWFLWAAGRLLWRNFHYGDPTLRSVNAFLLATFITRIFTFFIIVGSISTDLRAFTAYVGLSVAINGGMAVWKAGENEAATTVSQEKSVSLTKPRPPRRLGFS
jgi:hypothetical protein